MLINDSTTKRSSHTRRAPQPTILARLAQLTAHAGLGVIHVIPAIPTRPVHLKNGQSPDVEFMSTRP